jgi:hypothetical protein
MDRLPHAENSVAIDDPFARVLLAVCLAPPPTIGHVIDKKKWQHQQRKRTLVLVCLCLVL